MLTGRTKFGIVARAGLSFAALGFLLAACSGKSGGGGDEGSDDGVGGRNPNVVVKSLSGRAVDKADLLLMIDNSVSMADKQRLLVESLPVLVARLVDPMCVDADGEPAGGTASTGCAGGSRPEFEAVSDIHIGVITSSLGSHGSETCVAAENSTMNDGAELLGSVRTGLYSYQNSGFLVWDPRTERPSPDPHPGLSSQETNANELVTHFASHLQATGERGCAYEASLEAWYRFLIDPEPVRDVSNDGTFSVRGSINQRLLQQRAAFLRPDSLLAIVMLTDENDCSINDENGSQGWLVGRRSPMTRGSEACSRPDDPNIYRCCVPCVLLDSPDFTPPSGCTYGADTSCSLGAELTPVEDSANLRCFKQAARFGMNLLYPWERYADALKNPRIRLRTPNASGADEVPNPIYTPGADGTPARQASHVFLAGFLGVPWQDLAAPESLSGRGLRYLTAAEMSTASPNRWDVILGDPDMGRDPIDPFMIEAIDQRPAGMTHPLPGVTESIVPAMIGGARNAINGHEQNVVNRDDLQYACIFDLVPDVPCSTANADGCDCNADEQAYNRPTCQYPASGDGTQTHAKAYPAVRQLQVLKGVGDRAVLASICPKNVEALGGSPTADPDYGYNPAIGALVGRFAEALARPCLPRPLATENDRVPCRVVEALRSGGDGCSCDASAGRAPLSSAAIRNAVEDELTAGGLCGAGTGIDCSSYCFCEIEQLEGDGLNACRSAAVDPGNIHGFCYVDADNGNPSLVADCPSTERQIIRFLGEEVPRQGALAFVACSG